MAENVRRALLQTVSEELRGVEERRFRDAPPPTSLFVPLVDTAAERMDQEGADDPASIARARQAFSQFVRTARANAEGEGRQTLETRDVEAAMRGLCPIWPIC